MMERGNLMMKSEGWLPVLILMCWLGACGPGDTVETAADTSASTGDVLESRSTEALVADAKTTNDGPGDHLDKRDPADIMLGEGMSGDAADVDDHDTDIDTGGCIPDCADKSCGPNGCGGTCGECQPVANPCLTPVCVDGKCYQDTADGECDDGNLCTVGDLCVGGECLPGQFALICDDDNSCTDDSCDPDDGCQHATLDGDCDDGNACTQGDQCESELCVPGPAVDCSDDNPCTEDDCEPELGCFYENEVAGAECGAGLACNGNGECLPCLPNCEGKECGDNGCGGACGECTTENMCLDPDCVAGACQYVPIDVGECDDGDDCTTGDHCVQGECVATGAVGCNDGLFCTDDLCIDGECAANPQAVFCVIDNLCVPSGTEDPLNPCQKCAPAASPLQWSPLEDGVSCGVGKVCFEGSCCDPEPNCIGVECGDDGCGGACGTCPGLQQACVNGECVCVPGCDGKECGGDGCGGTCGGECPLGLSCYEGLCCEPQCEGKDCGDDGCGGNCGTCPAYHVCVDEICACVPNCVNSECGDDKCGGSCGDCDVCGEECVNSKCTYTACEGLSCGDDGCGGSCGECEGGFVCPNGYCQAAPVIEWVSEVAEGWALEATDVAVTGDGAYILLGKRSYGVADLDLGGGVLPNLSDGASKGSFLASYEGNSEGDLTHQWSKSLPATTEHLGTDGQGNIYVSGYTGLGVDLGCGEIPLEPLSWTAFIIKYTSSGQCIWMVTAPTGSKVVNTVTDLKVAPSGAVYAMGKFWAETIQFGDGPELQHSSPGGGHPSNSDGFLVRLDKDGNHIWSQSFGGSYVNPENISLHGEDALFIMLGTDYYVGQPVSASTLKIDSTNGALLSEWPYPGTPLAHSNGNVYFLGGAGWSMSFGDDAYLCSAYSHNGLLGAVDGNNTYLWSKALCPPETSFQLDVMFDAPLLFGSPDGLLASWGKGPKEMVKIDVEGGDLAWYSFTWKVEGQQSPKEPSMAPALGPDGALYLFVHVPGGQTVEIMNHAFENSNPPPTTELFVAKVAH